MTCYSSKPRVPGNTSPQPCTAVTGQSGVRLPSLEGISQPSLAHVTPLPNSLPNANSRHLPTSSILPGLFSRPTRVNWLLEPTLPSPHPGQSRVPGPLDFSSIRPLGAPVRDQKARSLCCWILYFTGSLPTGSRRADCHPPLKATTPAHNFEVYKILKSNLGF